MCQFVVKGGLDMRHEVVGLVEMDGMASFIDDGQIGRGQLARHPLREFGVPRVPSAHDQAHGHAQALQVGPERRLLSSAHAMEAAGQAMWAVVQSLRMLSRACCHWLVARWQQEWMLLPLGDERLDAPMQDT